MAGQGRNARCRCGSGFKTKRCCGIERGPSIEEIDRGFVAAQAREWAPVALEAASEHEPAALFEEMLDLPTRHYALQLRVPGLLAPELERLRAVIVADDEGGFDEAVGPAVARVDSSSVRARLVREIVALVEADEIHVCAAALAIVELARPRSLFLECALVEGLAVSAGAAATPSGLLVAAS